MHSRWRQEKLGGYIYNKEDNMLTRAVDGAGQDHYAYIDDPGFGEQRFCPYCKERVTVAVSRKGNKFYRILRGEHGKAYCRKLSHTKTAVFRQKSIQSFLHRFLTPEPEPRTNPPGAEISGTGRADQTSGAADTGGTAAGEGTFEENGAHVVSGASAAGEIPAAIGSNAGNAAPPAAGDFTASGIHSTDRIHVPAGGSAGKTSAVTGVMPAAEDDEDDADGTREIRKPMDVLTTGILDDIAAGNPSVGPIKELKRKIVYYPWARDLADEIRTHGGEYMVVCRLVAARETKTGNRMYIFRVFWRREGGRRSEKPEYDQIKILAFCNRADIAAAIDKRLPPRGKDGYEKHNCLLIGKFRTDHGILKCSINNRNQITFDNVGEE